MLGHIVPSRLGFFAIILPRDLDRYLIGSTFKFVLLQPIDRLRRHIDRDLRSCLCCVRQQISVLCLFEITTSGKPVFVWCYNKLSAGFRAEQRSLTMSARKLSYDPAERNQYGSATETLAPRLCAAWACCCPARPIIIVRSSRICSLRGEQGHPGRHFDAGIVDVGYATHGQPPPRLSRRYAKAADCRVFIHVCRTKD